MEGEPSPPLNPFFGCSNRTYRIGYGKKISEAIAEVEEPNTRGECAGLVAYTYSTRILLVIIYLLQAICF